MKKGIVEEAPFVHVEDDEAMGRSYDPYPDVWSNLHKRQDGLGARIKTIGERVHRFSKRVDDWCDESVFNYWIYILVMLTIAMVGVGIVANYTLF